MKYFKKELNNSLPPDIIQAVYENNCRYYESSLSLGNVYVPKPISLSANIITFEYIHELADKNNLLSERWYKQTKLETPIYRDLGEILGGFHKLHLIDKDNVYLHGDFVPHNILFSENKYIVFDVAPPDYVTNYKDYVEGSRYVDICSMIFFIFAGHTFSKPWRFLISKKNPISNFIVSYENAAGVNLAEEKIKQHVRICLDRWYGERKLQNGIYISFVKYIFLRIILLIQYSFYKAL